MENRSIHLVNLSLMGDNEITEENVKKAFAYMYSNVTQEDRNRDDFEFNVCESVFNIFIKIQPENNYLGLCVKKHDSMPPNTISALNEDGFCAIGCFESTFIGYLLGYINKTDPWSKA